jgi:hypothetical protein
MPQVYEGNLPRFLREVAKMDVGEETIDLNFGGVQYWIPAAIATMCAMANRWTSRGRTVNILNLDACPARGYLQRMDFFDRIGLTLPENFQRNTPGTSFVELQQILPGIARLHDPVAQRLGACLAGTEDATNDVLRFAQFAVGEIVANCQQHAGKPGFVAAQYVGSRDWARIGMADYGIGVLEGFRINGSPDYVEGMTDAEAIRLALQPWKSSKRHLKSGPYGESPNRGAGLTMIHHMIAESCGELMIASGNAVARIMGANPVEIDTLPDGLTLPGTVVSIQFSRGQIASFQELLTCAQQSMSLTSEPDEDIFS